ncbi:MAG: hypothetical protein HYU41_25455 [Candidatus Rokubacteria bacterium]|nr:hypothetical protein [Candidatus Rokubacteria bacterium]
MGSRRCELAVYALLVTLLPLLSGCVTRFREDHYFQSVSNRSGRATNYFRVRVDGYAVMSAARYIAGYYDERAVDLFFNEIKTGERLRLFEQDMVEPGGTEKLKPLSPEDKKGGLVMILSTNAKAVTDAIGQFTESQIVADTLTNLLNRRELQEARRSDARFAPEIDRTAAVAAELERLFAAMPPAVPPNTAPASKPAEDAYVRVLNALAAALGSTQSFATIKEAETWFRAMAVSGERR